MRLVLVRHGEAEPLRTRDGERVLTARGHQQAEATGAWLAGQVSGSVMLVCSTYQRAQETAGHIRQALPQAAFRIVEGITSEDDVRTAMVRLGAIDVVETLVVVSHMPLVAALAGWLADGHLAGATPFALAEARVYDVPLWGASQAIFRERFIPSV